jgi:ParB/RepB/Spo0J family partition protein
MKRDNPPQHRYKLPENRGTLVNAGLPGLTGPIITERTIEIPVDEVGPSPHQTRKNIDIDSPDIIEMAENIERVGLINPIIVRPNPDPHGQPRWILVAGERRLAAYKRLGKKTIRATIRENLKDDEIKSWSITLSENVMRRQLRPDEAGEAIELAKKLNLTNEEIANQIGVSERRVIQLHGALKLPEDLRLKLEEHGKLTHRHITAFKKLIGNKKITKLALEEDDTEDIAETKIMLQQLLDEIIEQDLSGEEALSRAKEMIRPDGKSPLTSVSQKLDDTIRKWPTRMKEQKRRLVIYQAKRMIEQLSKIIEKETANLKN